jgi:hypothetical protein
MFAVSKVTPYFTLPVSDYKYKIGYAGIFCRHHEVLHHRAVCHREHHFRAPGGEGAHAFSLASRQHNAFHRYNSSCNS